MVFMLSDRVHGRMSKVAFVLKILIFYLAEGLTQVFFPPSFLFMCFFFILLRYVINTNAAAYVATDAVAVLASQY